MVASVWDLLIGSSVRTPAAIEGGFARPASGISKRFPIVQLRCGLNLLVPSTGIGVVEASRTISTGASRRADEFTAWVVPHVSAMARLASRLAGATERDDVVQEALTAAWRKWTSFDVALGGPRSWLLAIVADQARKSRRRRLKAALPIEMAHIDRAADIDLERAVVRLPFRQRLAVELYYFLDLPVAEVAQTMGCSEGTVKATLSHARARLGREIGEEHG